MTEGDSRISNIYYLVPKPKKSNLPDNTQERLDKPIKDVTRVITRHLVARKDGGAKILGVRKRAVASKWPLDPSAPPKPRFLEGGKFLPDKRVKLWGETLLNFYYVSNPLNPYAAQITNGSKIMQWAQQVNTTNIAEKEIRYEQHEDIPRELETINIASLDVVRRMEALGGVHEYKGEKNTVEELCKKITKLPKPFDHTNYIPPWPVPPFSYPLLRLQKRLDLRLLPKKLHIHDPKKVLAVHVKKRHLENIKNFQTYDLCLTSDGQEKLETEREQHASRQAEQSAGTRGFFIHPPISSQSLVTTPPIFITLPPRPPPLEEIKEAHLYLSRARQLGEGNHSEVYSGELEVPTELFHEPEMCYKCVLETLDLEINNPKSGIVEAADEYRILWDPNVGVTYTECEITKAVVVEESVNQQDTKKRSSPAAGKLDMFLFWEEHRQVGLIDPLTGADARTRDAQGRLDNPRVARSTIMVRYPPYVNVKALYTGPLRILKSPVPWSNNQVPCKHTPSADEFIARCTPTMKVEVAVKLTVPEDTHLEKEAANYQQFPQHFFEHWSGYFVIPPLTDPVPCNAIVPQFYGHYKAPDNERGHLSPVLLLENCGTQISVDKLNMDKRNLCASLLHRMHLTGWVQGSVADRNFVAQDGPINSCESQREFGMVEKYEIFRVIDFGRAMQYEGPDAAIRAHHVENSSVQSMFNTKSVHDYR